jgi:hypothetical protein
MALIEVLVWEHDNTRNAVVRLESKLAAEREAWHAAEARAE